MRLNPSGVARSSGEFHDPSPSSSGTHRASAHSILRSTFVWVLASGNLDQPTPRGRALEDHAACFPRATFSTSCSTVSGLAASCSLHLQPGAARVIIPTRQDRGFNMYCNYVVHMHALRNSALRVQKRSVPSLSLPMALDGLSRLSGDDVDRSCGASNCVLYW